MASLARDRERRRLEQELQTDAYQEVLSALQLRESSLHSFRTWADVLAFMRAGRARDLRKDEVLRPILRFHRESEDARLGGVLLAIFWSSLESIQVRKRHWDDDADERWQNIVQTFFSVVSRVDVAKRPERLVQKIHNDTIHHLHDLYARQWRRADLELLVDPAMFDTFAGRPWRICIDSIDERKARDREIERLRRHLDAGRINDADFLLLMGTRVYGQSVADYARAAGLKYQAAKKRRQRAEASIAEYVAVSCPRPKVCPPPCSFEGGRP